MASKRRGGFGPPELRGTLGTLIRTTTGVVRDALERGAREGRARLDDARASRRRLDALADLGELVLDLIRRGEIDLAELPEARDLVRQLDDLDAEADDTPPPPPPPSRRPSSRSRFDDRPSRTRPDDRPGRDDDPPSRTRSDDRASDDRDDDRRSRARSDDRASADRDDDRDDDRPGRTRSDDRAGDDRPGRTRSDDRPSPSPRFRRPDTSDDGTVSSGVADRSMRPTVPARPKHDSPSARVPTQPIKGLWRPRFDDDEPAPAAPTASASTASTSSSSAPPSVPSVPTSPPIAPTKADLRRPAPPDPSRKGGISFDDDDLADYMHPDDVPAKPPRTPSDPTDSDA